MAVALEPSERLRIVTRGGLLSATAALSLLGACAQYDRVEMEFDSATGFVSGEPDLRVEYRDQAQRWPWGIRQLEGTGFDAVLIAAFGYEPTLKEQDNPTQFARERVQLMAELADGRWPDSARAAQRILWILEQPDESPLNEIVAIDAAAYLLDALEADPLAVPAVGTDPVATRAREERATEVLTSLAPARREDAGVTHLGEADLKRYIAALEVVRRRPSLSSARQRRWIHLLTEAPEFERDERVFEASGRAMVAVVVNGLADRLRLKLQSDTSPAVREAALLALVRASGPAAVPFSLRALARARASGNRFDSSVRFRRTWVRLCSQLPKHLLFVSIDGGPKPIEYLYETATRDEDEGLRRVALDALARSLERPTDPDPAWADAWWADYNDLGTNDG